MPVVSVRMDDADLAWVKEHAGNVSEFVRDAVRRAIEADRFKASQQRLANLAQPAVVPPEELIRRNRDADAASRRAASLAASRAAIARARATRTRASRRRLLGPATDPDVEILEPEPDDDAEGT